MTRPAFTPLRAMLWMLGSFLVMVLFALVYFAIDENAPTDLVGLGIVSSASFLLMSALLVGRYPGGSQLSEPLGVRPSHPLAFTLGFLIGVSAKVPAEQLSYWILELAPRSPGEEARFLAMFEAKSSLHAAFLLFVIAVLVPISEEIFFRGAVYGALRRNRTKESTAALVTAIGFAFCHADARQLLPILLVALLLGALRTFSGSILPGLAAHMSFNGVAILGATYDLLPDVQELSIPFRWGATGSLVVFMVLLVWVVGNHPRALASRLAEMRALEDGSDGDQREST